LFLQLLREAAARLGAEDRGPTPEMLSDLTARDWPGNVRELRNVADRHVLGLDWMEGAAGTPLSRLADRVAGFERSVIGAAIAAHGGRLRGVYESLGISRKTLYEKMQKHGLDRRLILDGEASDE
jgi:two-component system C4-dicarboxylate transport response regulator DctD